MLRRPLLVPLTLLVLATTPACSAIVSPDLTRLGVGDAGSLPGDDGGPLPGDDGGPLPGDDGGPLPGDDGGPLPDGGPGCVPGCRGGTLTECVGGTPTTTRCDLGCAPDGAACGEMGASNVDPDLWSGDAEDVHIDGAARFDTSTCTSALTSSVVFDQPGGPSLCVYQVRDLIIEDSGRLDIVGSRPFVVMATGDVEIHGTIDVSAELDRPGPGGGIGGRPSMPDGIGPAFGRGGVHAGMFDDGGGGGGGFCGAGGAGGGGGSAGGGMAGARSDPMLLVPLRGGSGGGAGAGALGARPTVGIGGAGGGAIQISALGRVRISGEVLAGGGGGHGGGNAESVNWGAGGGGGSGGGILIEAPEVLFDPGAVLGASGGGGGGGASTSAPGGDGTDGRLTRARAMGGASGGTALGAPGGDSGGGSAPDARAGGSNAMTSANGGGGGGGAGCIVIRTASGMLPAGVSTGWSPSGDGVSFARVLTR